MIGATPQPRRGELAKAARGNDLKAARDLLAKGADVYDDFFGVSALCRAARYGNTEMARLLIENGADVNRKDKSGSVPLIKAAYRGHIETVQLLIGKGADLEIRGSTGATALISASQNDQNTEIVRFLIEKGADIDAQDDTGETALFKAADFGNRNMVRLLVDKGADPEIETNGGRSAAQARYRYPEIDEMIAEAIELKKRRLREATVVALEKKRHDAVAVKQQSLRAHAPKFRLRAGP
jgi:ankyrin repeat protein